MSTQSREVEQKKSRFGLKVQYCTGKKHKCAVLEITHGPSCREILHSKSIKSWLK